ncbi:uncharacterized protein LOC106130565 isoform X3 [Amyelois transitella]|uniref:uncharacterized protein LOC106130565 isoform X3 n=1 Tax=Amyelois transitella TaxID=680683 RepID=UPI002990334A|nr:uncharacterized protein LOC106130565 isoform X3 [Amyelois transitella]
MFKIESYVTPILLSYVDKYVRDFKPADAQVSLWGGGVALHNLVLKADVLQQEVSLPFTLVSGRIHELLIQVPWTKIMSEPIVVTIDTIECVLSLNPPASPDASQPPESPSRKTQVVEAPPGYMQALVRRIVSNIALRVHHLIVKYVQDDIVMSLNVKHVAVDSAGVNWEPAFADIDPSYPVIRRLVQLDDLTLCLDRADSDGKIRYYQEPLLYRCQLNFRVSTKLVSANTRRASSIAVQLRSSKLAFSVTNDQLVLLIRLLRERSMVEAKQPPPPVKTTNAVREAPLHSTSSNSAEPVRQESWSEWAWSWLPTWADREGGVEEAPLPATPLPVYFVAYLDDISLAYKIMELEATSRKRARSILEFSAIHAAIKSSICSPTTLRVRFGARLLTLSSHGKCVCGHVDLNASQNQPTIYLKKAEVEDIEWNWPEDDFNEHKVECAQVADEEYRVTPEPTLPTPDTAAQSRPVLEETETNPGDPEEPITTEPVEETDLLFQKMAPVFYVEYTHERSPPNRHDNPYDNPPRDFEYSDWVEMCNMKVKVHPIEVKVCMGLIHRVHELENVLNELPPLQEQELGMRTLTVEENEALQDNLPQRKIVIEMQGVNIVVHPLDHLQNHHERPSPSPIMLNIDLPDAIIVINGPLYPNRVCSAACQLPEDSGPLFQGARLTLSVAIPSLQFRLLSPRDTQPRQCARTDLRLVVHVLLNKKYFDRRQTVQLSYTMKIREINLSGSAARLEAAYRVPASLMRNQVAAALRYTSLPNDAIHDEAVTVDLTIEDIAVRGYLTKDINTHIMSVQAARATAFHAQRDEEVKQAWIFSAPEAPSTTPYLRLAMQWCAQPLSNSLDYLGVWTEPMAFSVDPLFITFLAYKPHMKNIDFNTSGIISAKSSQFFQRRRTTPPSSSGRSSGREAELVHVRPRSSSSEPSEKKEQKPEQPPPKPRVHLLSGENLLSLYERLRRMLLNVELGLVLVYVTSSTASALDCATVRDAMERHASNSSVLALGLGRLSMHSSSTKKHLWQEIRHDGPTFIEKKSGDDDESFPWKVRLAEMSCFTLETASFISEKEGIDKSASGLRSQIKMISGVHPRTVLELTTTTVTLSVVTKSLHIKVPMKTDKKKSASVKPEEEKLKYFTTGSEFKPSTLKEFLRGPAKRKKTDADKENQKQPTRQQSTETVVGPVVSLGVHMHADTPPVIVRISHDQVHVMASAIHCFKHIVTLLQRPPIVTPRYHTSQRSLIRSVTEIDEVRDSQSESTISESSELISIYEAKSAVEPGLKLKKFFWFQWVVGRATLVVSTPQVKFAFDIDDVITTVDLQEHYNQFKLKLASASVKHYERLSEDWTAGVLGGRVLEAREPTNQKEENHFISITVTQAQISNLPESWKHELHPKMLERRSSTDTMWEIYVSLAPLEAVLQPVTLQHLVLLLQQMAPGGACVLRPEPGDLPCQPFIWPFLFVTAGGIRLLLTGEEEDPDSDDTFIFTIGKISVNPHPENPICRRPIASTDPSWATANTASEGRQYDVLVKSVAVRSAQFRQIVKNESAETVKGQENPAVKWTRPRKSTVITPVLHSVDVGFVLAPAHYTGGILIFGPAIEINLMSDCAIELSVEQLILARQIMDDVKRALADVETTKILSHREEKFGVCPYADLLKSQEYSEESSSSLLVTGLVDASETMKADSGIDTGTSQHSTNKSVRHLDRHTSVPFKKAVSVVFADTACADSSEYLEVFVTMGIIEISLYVADDNSPEIVALRTPADYHASNQEAQQDVKDLPPKEEMKRTETTKSLRSENASKSESRESITDDVRRDDFARTNIDMANLPIARKCEGNLPLMHATLYQPNLYYWKKKNQQSLQVSLFNVWLGLGVGEMEGHWHLPLLSTAKGVPDPATDIPPALATMKIVAPNGSTLHSSTGARGTMRLDVERPVQVEVSADRLRRIKSILMLIEDRVITGSSMHLAVPTEDHVLYKLRRFMVKYSMESVTVQTGQICVSGSCGTGGWDSASLQVACGARPERVLARGLVTALLVAAGPPGDRRQLILQPMMMGMDLEATWEAWRRAEFGSNSHVPTVRGSLNLDYVTIDLRPSDLAALNDILELFATINNKPESGKTRTLFESEHTLYESHKDSLTSPRTSSTAVTEDADLADHYYKDDLRSGAFKMVSGGQLPMAYQVMVHGHSVSWRYPHPRAITRIVAFPIPGLDEEVDCVLELYSLIQKRWMAHTYFTLPISEPREIKLYVTPPEAVFALTWRFRPCDENTEEDLPFEFNVFNYMPKEDPLITDASPDRHAVPTPESGVTAEQLSGVLRVDSYFAPRMLPRLRLALRFVSLDVNLHNSLPKLSSRATELEGYYVSRPLMRSHRVLTLLARDFNATLHMGSQAGSLFSYDTKLSADILETATGAIEEMVEEFRVRGAVSLPRDSGVAAQTRVRCRSTRLHFALNVPRVRTIHALATDWLEGISQQKNSQEEKGQEHYISKGDIAKATAAALEGRVSLWIHNSCGSALRVGQEGTDEVVPLAPGARLAYRWRSPTAKKRLRFAVAGPTTDWRWSSSIPFVAGSTRVRLEEGECLGDGKVIPGAGVFMYVRVEETSATKSMHLVGRLTLANMLRHDLLYKVRARCSVTNQWRTVCSGELTAESVGRTVICGADCEMVLKVKFLAHEAGWSGDIPLKECPKENVPWLVKVPSAGDVPYTSVWCRVTRARSDGRVLATVWPLYVLHSHLPLDTVVMVTTNAASVSSAELPDETPPTLIQTAPGRGTSTHLLAPGTTSARHTLSFQYKNIDCPVTREAVPMHYGVTDSSVFDKRPPVANIDDIVEEVQQWLRRSSLNATSNWPYSLVTKHWPLPWQPALLQPRCDVTVRYQAVRAGGGCSLEIQLCPVVLLCNAAPIALTLRAHDAAPLCKLEPGTAISLPMAVLKKPFFMSVEMGRETFVSGQLEVDSSEPGVYGAPPPGKLAVDHSADFAILCNHKVALLTMYYEIKEDINILGASATYVVLNRLDMDILVSPVAVPMEMESNVILRSATYKVVPPTKPDSIHGTPLGRFWLRSRWRGNSPSELRHYICLGLPYSGDRSNSVSPAHGLVPIRLGMKNMCRRSVALIDWNHKSIPVVVTQMKQDGRFLISVAPDPCPQFVVHNRTVTTLTIAQPVKTSEEPSTSITVAERECDGTRWFCTIPPGAITHYSTPAHCARYPPPAVACAPELPFLIFAKAKEEVEPQWCPAVVAADGEQLLQLQTGITLKLRVRTYPHSTLLELQDVDHTDLSASDIRKRLYGPFADSVTSIQATQDASGKLQRVGADDKLLRPIYSQSDTQVPNLPSQTARDKSAKTVSTPPPQDHVVSLTDLKPIPVSSSGQLGVIKDVTKSNLQIGHTESLEDLNEDTISKAKKLSIDIEEEKLNLGRRDNSSSDSSLVYHDIRYPVSDWEEGESWPRMERARCVLDAIVIEVSATSEARPLLALHAGRVAVHVLAHNKKTKTTVAISDVQIDNLQYETGQFDFGVVASTRNDHLTVDRWPPIWNLFANKEAFKTRKEDARLLLMVQHDKWTVADFTYNEITEVEMALGPLALYVEDAYVSALIKLWRLSVPPAPLSDTEATLADERILQRPLRLRMLHLRPLEMTLTLHTAFRMYIALDQSPLRLSAFRLQDMMTSPERLTHALTVHYLSAAILGAGWVVGGLELLGAPGALATRLGEASGGVRGIVSATAAALLRSFSAWAGSLARNLDMLAGDEEHARRAAAARRRPPQTFMAGLAAGITNFAINILGAVGGLAHHPLVGVAVGETESGAAALRRGLVGALAKPLSATADLVAYAGHGLLSQTGWDPIPQPRILDCEREQRSHAAWRRDCVRWSFRLCELTPLGGFEVLLDNAPLLLLLTHKFLVVADTESERIVEMIDFRFCSVGPYHGAIIELSVTQRRSAKLPETRATDEDDEYQISAAAMARVARYTGAEGASSTGEARVLALMCAPARSHALYAALAAAIHHNADSHFSLL